MRGRGRPEEVFTREMLNEAYQSHLMRLDVDGRIVAVEKERTDG